MELILADLEAALQDHYQSIYELKKEHYSKDTKKSYSQGNDSEKALSELNSERCNNTEQKALNQIPVINSKSRRIALERRKAFGPYVSLPDRLLQQRQASRLKHERQRVELEQEKIKELRSGPKINKSSKKLVRSVEDMYSWEMKRSERIESQRKKKSDLEMKQWEFSPQLCQNSKDIVKRMEKRRDTEIHVTRRKNYSVAGENGKGSKGRGEKENNNTQTQGQGGHRNKNCLRQIGSDVDKRNKKSVKNETLKFETDEDKLLMALGGLGLLKTSKFTSTFFD